MELAEAVRRALQLPPDEMAEAAKLISSVFGVEPSAQWEIPQEPTERQALFLSLNEIREVFYGGAAGGGKSSCLLMAALEYVYVKGYAALLLRRTYADLSKPGALMDRAHQWLRGTDATWNEQKKQWTFPSGASLTFGYIDTENDKYNYQGAEYQFIGFDELTQFKESAYTYLFSRLRRLEGVDVPLRMRSASNPGGIGADWVNQRFVPEGFTPEMARENVVRWKEGEDDEGEPTLRAFVPATLDDNPHLDRAEYRKSLSELDPVTREQLLKGDWQIQERGDILSMWTDREAHVITWSQFESVFGTRYIPFDWLLGVYQDWGTTAEHPCVTSWFATAPANSPVVRGVHMAGSVFLYRGLTVWDMTVREVASEINRLMSPHGETSRIRKMRMSHEASSERLAYQREHHLNFQAWKTGKTRGIAQLRNALELVDTDKPHPFNPSVSGHPKLYHVVDDDQLLYAKDDRGLARHRAEAPAYHWATLRSGEPTVSLLPYALFNDAMDTERAAAADYFPMSKAKSENEKREEKLRPEVRLPAILAEENPDLQQAKIQTRDLQMKRTRAQEEKERSQLRKMSHPKVRFRR